MHARHQESAVEETSVHSCNTTRHETVDFTICFEDTVFLCGICTTFSLAAGLRLLLGNHKGPPVPFNRLNAIKTVSSVSNFATYIGSLYSNARANYMHAPTLMIRIYT